MLPGRSEVSLAATTLCCLQLYREQRSSASKLSCSYYTYLKVSLLSMLWWIIIILRFTWWCIFMSFSGLWRH